MLEIIALIYLWRANGANARMRGKKAIKYQLLTLALWFGMELAGVVIGMLFIGALFSEAYTIYGSYLFGIIGAVFGGYLSHHLAKSGPITNASSHHHENSVTNHSLEQGGYMFNEMESTNESHLKIPATVFIREELGGYGGNQDLFYLNGNYIGSLYPGMECILKTAMIKNTITIGSPSVDPTDTKHSVRFVAAENGKVEIYASEGCFIPELFKNKA